MVNFSEASLETLIAKGGHECACGRRHEMVMDYLSICPGAVKNIPAGLKAIGGLPLGALGSHLSPRFPTRWLGSSLS